MHYLNNWGKKSPSEVFQQMQFIEGYLFCTKHLWNGEHTMGKVSMRLFRKGADKGSVVCGVNAENGEGFPILPHPGLAVCCPSGGWGGGMVHLSPSAWERHLWPPLHTLTGFVLERASSRPSACEAANCLIICTDTAAWSAAPFPAGSN